MFGKKKVISEPSSHISSLNRAEKDQWRYQLYRRFAGQLPGILPLKRKFMRRNVYSKLTGFLMLLLSAVVVMVFQTLSILNDLTAQEIRRSLSTLDNVELFQGFEDLAQTYGTTGVSEPYFLTPTALERVEGHKKFPRLLQNGRVNQIEKRLIDLNGMHE